MVDDPGTVLFTQKRVGKDKRFIQIHKFRSMKMNTPSDVPTHMLYIPKDSKMSDDLLKQQLIRFSDLNLSLGGPQNRDERFELLRKVIDIDYEEI